MSSRRVVIGVVSLSLCVFVMLSPFRGGQRRGVFELLADKALQIRPDSDLRLAFIYNLSPSAMQSGKYSRRDD